MSKHNIIWKIWEKNAELYPERIVICHYNSDGASIDWSYRDLISRAKSYSELFLDLGINQGCICAIIMKHDAEFYPIYMALTRIGAIPTILAYPNLRLHLEKFHRGIYSVLDNTGLNWIISDNQLYEKFSPDINIKEKIQISNLTILNIDSTAVETIGFSFLQQSSGTTGNQKSILITHEMLRLHCKHYSASIELSDQDKIISWLPLYHDMGFITSFHMPLIYGVLSVQISPIDWVSNPVSFFEAISKHKGTLAWLPNFAFSFLADRIRDEQLKNIDLKSLRLLVNCSEPLQYLSEKKFFDRYKDYGIKSECISSSYAMAETTFAITQSKPNLPSKKISVDKNFFDKGKILLVGLDDINSKVIVSSGSPISNVEIKIKENSNSDRNNNSIGEILVKSDTMIDRYFGKNFKREVLEEGWLCTGDLGFIYDDELFVTSRKNDMIISAGRNIFPNEIENLLNEISGVKPGRIVVFGIDDESIGTQKIIAIVETEIVDENERKAFRASIIKHANSFEYPIDQVYLAPPRWLIKSSSGKISRVENAARLSELKKK